uniref:AlNc14C52G4084 protein n=1 Tax=Albugo laibachii Nc14 TaxID=890382 RepID=F0WBP2_9STRA|nr:AlNc14C52G4084 [Albugo laibachii Nc14]|eukprot:CCA18569.1 AlNc14C52G4084 [Albugo laibachii Nc14]
MGCGAKVYGWLLLITACVQYQKDKWCVHVTTVTLEHNHEVSKRTYDLYYDPMASSYTLIKRKVALEISRLSA